MKVPCRWLADYVDIEVSDEALARLAERLTLAGIEVEGIEKTGSLRNAVVGRVVSSEPLPKSDHLTLCVVDIGSEAVERLQRQRSDWDEPEDAISRATAYRNRNTGPPVSVITAYPGWHRRASQVDVWSGK